MQRIIKNVEDFRIALEAEREIIREQIHKVNSQVRWIDWYTQFGDRINQMADFSPEEKHKLLQGVIEKITVKTTDLQTHEILIKFKLPYVNDSFEWKDKKKKSLGYTIGEGDYGVALEIDSGKKSRVIS